MNDEHIQQLNHIDIKVDELENRFNKHLEIYANNGKEAARLAQAVEQLVKRSGERDKITNEMFEIYQKFQYGKSGIMWLILGMFGLFMSIGSAILLVKQILGK